MSLYQWFYFTIELAGFGILTWIFCNFAIGMYSAFELFIKDFKAMIKEQGGFNTTIFFILGFLNNIGSFILLVIVLYLFPVFFILIKEFAIQVVYGKSTLSQFIAYIPEAASSVANYYYHSWGDFVALLHRVIH